MDNDTLYYDGDCPFCNSEIKKLEKYSSGSLELKNIHELSDGEVTRARSLLLSRLHLQTANGEWITGLKANIRAWQHTPFGALWRMLDWPLINRASHWCYETWLRWRNRSALLCCKCQVTEAPRKPLG